MKLQEIVRYLALWAAGPLLFAAEPGDPFLGRWEGRYRTTTAETGLFQADVIPQGGNFYLLWVRMGELGSRYKIEGTRRDEKLVFRGRFQVVSGTDDAAYDLVGEIREWRLTGSFESPEGNGTIELTKAARVALAPEKAPEGALQLFDGKSLVHWQRPDGGPPDWRLLADGSMEAGKEDLVSRRSFASFRLHVEFLLPLMAEARGQDRANSGVIVAGSHEVHLLDTFGGEPTKTSCGAINGVAAPRLEATLPPLEWQALDITVRSPPVAPAGGAPAQRTEITVVFNGVTIHERRVLDDFRESAIRLRTGGGGVRFRHIWIEALNEGNGVKPVSSLRFTGDTGRLADCAFVVLPHRLFEYRLRAQRTSFSERDVFMMYRRPSVNANHATLKWKGGPDFDALQSQSVFP